MYAVNKKKYDFKSVHKQEVLEKISDILFQEDVCLRLILTFAFGLFLALYPQVLAYVEDFKSERADRERAHGKIQDLQEEVGRLQLQIRVQASQSALFLLKTLYCYI